MALASSRRAVCWAAAIMLLAAAGAYGTLHRVQQGQLFLLPLPMDRAAASVERIDARQLAGEYLWLGTITAGIAVALVPWGLARVARRGTDLRGAVHQLLMRRRPWLVLLVISTIFDLATTLWFFHDAGIDAEFHVGVRLFGYAFGRTAGPILAKGLQCLGIFFLSAVLPTLAPLLCALASLSYLLAAGFNVVMSAGV